MKKFYIIPAMLITGLLALGMAGCSSKSIEPDPLLPGDNNDANFQWVEEEVLNDQIYEGIDVSLELAETLIDSIPGASPTRPRFTAGAAADGDFVLTGWSYSYANDWHIFDFAGHVTDNFGDDTITIGGIDSIQILSNGVPQQVPDETMDAFSYNMHFAGLNSNGTDSIRADHAIQMALAGTEPEVAVIDGQLDEAISFAYTDSAQTATCQVNLTSSFTAAGITMPTEGEADCPLDGSIVVTVSLAMDCAGGGENPFALSVDGSWTATGTFDGTHESFTITDGTSSWSSTEPCGQSTSPGVLGL